MFETSIIYLSVRNKSVDIHESGILCPPTVESGGLTSQRELHFDRDGDVMT